MSAASRAYVSDDEVAALVRDGCTYEEIAERCGLEYSSVAKRLYALRQKGIIEKRPKGGSRSAQTQRKALKGGKEPPPPARANIATIDGRPVVPSARLVAGR